MQLGDHVLARADRASPPGTGPQRDWVASEFTYPLRALLWATARSRRAYMFLNLIIVAGGFATSGIAIAAGSGTRGSATSWVVFGIGFVVAIVGGANQLFRPGYRATQRTTVALDMREEGWSFAMATGDYAGDDAKAFTLFQRRVSQLQRRLAQIDAIEMPTASGNRDSRKGGQSAQADEE